MKKFCLHFSFYIIPLVVLTFCLAESDLIFQHAMAQPAVEMPFRDKWFSSAHADATARAFTHWDEEMSKKIPVECARCHSTPGYRDFIGEDGSPAGIVDKPAPIGTVIECIACHNETSLTMDSVKMPSGVEITGLGREARCMQCHQGRVSKFSVDHAIEKANVPDVDTINPELGLIDIHYYAATATKYGTVAKGGYQYAGKSYDAYFAHVDQFDTCEECHDPHTLQVRIEQCSACHPGVKRLKDLRDIRMEGSLVDYDGDGNIEEGIYYEIDGLQQMLFQAIQLYAANQKKKTAIVHDVHNYPYFFIDTNNNDRADAREIHHDNAYTAWTARLFKAAYNYQLSAKDPGMFAHGGKYVIQLLYDSIEDLNAALPEPIALDNARRTDDGHFAGFEEAFRHWDDDGKVPGQCSKCHSSAGLPLYLEEETSIAQPPANGFQCSTCHNDLLTFTRHEVSSVKFPSGIVVDSKDADTNLCMTCHQGRESTVLVNRFIKGLDNDKVYDMLHFQNIHYLSAGATLFGGEAKGAYEYDGKRYVGVFTHTEGFRSCTACHSAHRLDVKTEECRQCHSEVQGAEGFRAIRMSPVDYDGDGNTKEGIAGEIDTLRDVLYATIQEYAGKVAGSNIVYDPSQYPYYFIDKNDNHTTDADEIEFSNRYAAWTPNLLRAAYNYQYSTKDPGDFAHNAKYILQILYDSLDNLATKVQVNMTDMVRP